MKNLTNILSYLWLLLLMAVTACSDMEGEVDAMEVEEEVELTIRAELSEMATSTRAVPTESIYSITALAFDVDSKLIKVVAATLSIQQATSGTLKVKVPLRTRSIHFLANDAAGITANDLGKTPNELLKKDVGSLYYWGMASFQGNNAAEAAAALKAYAGPLTLYRNQAKVTLVGGNGDYIVGFLNYNTRGRLVPYDANGTIGYQASVQTSAGTPSPQSHTKDDNISGQQYTEYFLFEHDNENNEKNSALYAICYIGGKYYKVAFASSKTYFDIVRNHNYRIVTTGIDTMYGEDSFDAAEDSNYPINDKVIDDVQGMTATAEPALISNTAGTTTQVTVTIPESLTELIINAGTAFTVTSNESLAVNANGSYNITGRTKATFTLTLKDEAAGTTGEQTINCTARAKYKEATCSTTVTLQQPTANAIVAEPVAYSLDYTTGENSVSDLLVYVTIQKDVTTLTFASDYFDAMVVGQTLALTDDAYAITHDENVESTTIPVRLRLKQDKKADTNASFTFGSKDANVESATINNIYLNPVSGENVRWQGNVPLNSADYATIVPLKWEWFRTGDSFIPVGSKLNLEFTVTGDNTSWLEIFEIRGDTENDWNNPVHQFAELNNSNRYTADGNGNRTLSLTLSDYTFTTIFENFRSEFLGETDIAMAIRGAGITLKKVSILPATALGLELVVADANNPSLTYGPNSIEDLQVKVTIPAGVTLLTFSSDDFTIRQATDKKKGETAYLGTATNSNNGKTRTYEVNNVTEPTTLPFLLRLKDGVEKESATFTFSGSGEDFVVYAEGSVLLVRRNPDDETIYWEGYLPLNLQDNTAKLSIPKKDLKENQYLVIECTKPINGAFGLLHDWQKFETNLEYRSPIVEVLLTKEIMDAISETLIITGRDYADMKLLKVSMVPSISQVNKILITAPGAAEGVSDVSLEMSYSNQSAIEEYTITVTVPDGVTQLNYINNGFSNVYIDTDNWYTTAQSPITISDSKSIPLKLRVDKDNSSPTITFKADGAVSASFTVNRTDGTPNSNVVWEGASQFQGYDVHVSKIDIPYNLLQGNLLDGAVLTVEYELTTNDNGGFLSIHGSGISNWANLKDVAAENYSDNNNTTITMTLNPTIIENIGSSAINMQGYGRVLKKVTLTPPAETPPVVTHSEFTYNFEDGVEFGDWDTNITTTDIVYDPNDQSNKVLKIVVDDNQYDFGQIGISNGDYSGKYTLSLKYKAETSTGKINLVFQYEYKDENGENKYTERIKYEEGKKDENILSTDWKDITWDLNFAEQANQFIIQFEYVSAGATFYIDDLKLVKNNQ